MKLGIRARFLLIALGLLAPLGVVVLMAPVHHLSGAELLALAVVPALGVALVLSSLAARLVARAAHALNDVARRTAVGDLGVRTDFDNADELGELSGALDQLARSLQGSLGELVNERDRYGGILSGMQEGVLLLDEEGRVELINPALREMLLLDADAAGKTTLELIRHAELKELLDEAARTTAHVTREIELGGLKPCRLLVRAAPLPGERDGLFAVFVDVTEMRRLESLRRDFVANVSHELRTPVTAIRSAAETLHVAARNDPDAVARFVDIIERNAERLHDLVEDLLDLSRIESREFRVRFEPVDLEPVFSQVLSLFRERAEKRNVRLVSSVAPGVPLARADRHALENVLTNLVDNAVKYGGSGTEVRLVALEEGELIRVSVEDTGPGIEARHLPRLFERFYRVDSGRSRELGGTGLGLSIVKHLVEAMNGNVGVDSTPGRGTAFRFTLERSSETLSHAGGGAASAQEHEPRVH